MAKASTDKKKIEELLTRGVEDVVVRKDLEKKLLSGRVLRVKHGVDPTSADLHLGYSVIYRKLRVFQDLGHTVVFLIGGFTGRFGDPTDKTESRKMRDKSAVDALAKNYLDQLSKILDIGKVEVRNNAEWYDKMSAEDLLHLMSEFTLQQMEARDMFQERKKKGLPIGLHEPVYPVLQGYDSVELKSDLTVIGSDQLFNELQARPQQERHGQVPQDVLVMKLLVGTDGKQKMSQSLGNYIGLSEDKDSMYGKVMSIPDELIIPYFELCTDVPLDGIKEIQTSLKNGENPRDAKARLAKELVRMYHSETDAAAAALNFDSLFKKKEVPEDVPTFKLIQKTDIIDLLLETGLVSSKSEARRLIDGGGIKLDGQAVEGYDVEVSPSEEGVLIQKGKRRFMRIVS